MNIIITTTKDLYEGLGVYYLVLINIFILFILFIIENKRNNNKGIFNFYSYNYNMSKKNYLSFCNNIK